MRVLILLNARFPTEKAYGLQVLAMARGFAESGVEVGVAYPRRSREIAPSVPGVTFIPFGPTLVRAARTLFPLYRLIGLFGLQRVATDFRPDIVLVNDPVQAAFFPKPWTVVWDLHDFPDPSRWDRRSLVRRILLRVTGIVSTNQLKLDRLSKVGALPPTVVLPNPLTLDPSVYRGVTRDQAKRERGIPEGEFAIVYAGQLFDWKGVDTLIEAARHLRAPSVIHIVGGTGTDLERCQGIASRLPPDAAHVVFHGQRPSDEVPTWLRAADVVVVPNSGKHRISVEDTNPLKLYEALATGAAIIASDLPSIREAIGTSSAVMYVRPDDARSLADALTSLTQETEKIRTMQAAAEAFPVMTGKQRAERLAEFFRPLCKK